MKDKRYKAVKLLIDNKDITTFAGIFDHIPKTAVADDLGLHFSRTNRMIEDVNAIRVADIFLFAGYFEVDAKVIFDLIYNQRAKKTLAKKKA